VRRNTPIRVRIRTGPELDPAFPTTYLLWQGEAYSWTPAWDITGRNATVELEAAGTLRRLKQGQAPAVSVLRRSLPALSGLLAYWPCEDDKQATSIASGIPGGEPMALRGGPSSPRATTRRSTRRLALPLIRDSAWSGNVPPYTDTGKIQLRFLLNAEDEGTYPIEFSKHFVKLHLAGGSFSHLTVSLGVAGEGDLQLVGYAPGSARPRCSRPGCSGRCWSARKWCSYRCSRSGRRSSGSWPTTTRAAHCTCT
jgi:hypothetical protein